MKKNKTHQSRHFLISSLTLLFTSVFSLNAMASAFVETSRSPDYGTGVFSCKNNLSSVSASAPDIVVPGAAFIISGRVNAPINTGKDIIFTLSGNSDHASYTPSSFSQPEINNRMNSAGIFSLTLTAPNTVGDYQIMVGGNNGYPTVSGGCRFSFNGFIPIKVGAPPAPPGTLRGQCSAPNAAGNYVTWNTTSVSGGSGNYKYQWGNVSPGLVFGGSGNMKNPSLQLLSNSLSSGVSYTPTVTIQSQGATDLVLTCPVYTKQIREDCVYHWGDWSVCSNGTQYRDPIISTPSANGGIICPTRETRVCGQPPAGTPDLTAVINITGNLISGIDYAEGSNLTLWGAVQNELVNGSSITTPFQNYYQYRQAGSPSWIYWQSAGTMPSLDRGSAMRVSDFSWLPGTDGLVYEFRLCADKNATGRGVISESDEDNNCSQPVSARVVAAEKKPGPTKLTAEPLACESDQIKFTWTPGHTQSYNGSNVSITELLQIKRNDGGWSHFCNLDSVSSGTVYTDGTHIVPYNSGTWACISGGSFPNRTITIGKETTGTFRVAQSTYDSQKGFPVVTASSNEVTATVPGWCLRHPDLTASIGLEGMRMGAAANRYQSNSPIMLRGTVFHTHDSPAAVNQSFNSRFEMRYSDASGNLPADPNQGWTVSWHGGAAHVTESLAKDAFVRINYSWMMGAASPVVYQFRLCADHGQNIAESNETNNCSPVVTVISADPPPEVRPNHCGFGEGRPEHKISYTSTQAGCLKITTAGSGYDTGLAVYGVKKSNGELQLVACDNDCASSEERTSSVFFPTDAHTRYEIVVINQQDALDRSAQTRWSASYIKDEICQAME